MNNKLGNISRVLPLIRKSLHLCLYVRLLSATLLKSIEENNEVEREMTPASYALVYYVAFRCFLGAKFTDYLFYAHPTFFTTPSLLVL